MTFPAPLVRSPFLRSAVALVNLCLAGAVLAVAWPRGSEAVQAPPPPEPPPRPWAPPAWYPAETAAELWVIPALDVPAPKVKRGPKVHAPSAIIADLDRGVVVWERNADEHRPVASLTKLVSSLALASTEADLAQPLCVTRAEWPTRSGARSRFETGACHQGWEWLGAALVASDNRGAMGLASLSGLDYADFIDQMTEVSRDLRMEADTWSDPAGLEDDNRATARDMLKAVVAVAHHPTLAVPASASYWKLDRDRGRDELGSTNKLLSRWETLAAKTGYTDTAKYCFATVVRTDEGKTYAVAVLGAPNSAARFADTTALVQWASEQ